MYIETSTPRVLNDRARLISPVYTNATKPSCLQFWYMMYGYDTVDLNVNLVTSKGITNIWTVRGNVK